MESTRHAADLLLGYDVMAGSGQKLGTVENVWVDEATNEAEFVGVRTGWLLGKIHVVPTADAQIGGGSIALPYTEDQIKNAPSFDGDSELSPQDEESIYGYFGLGRSTASSPTGLPAGDLGSATTGTAAGTMGSRMSDTTLENVGEIDVPVSEEELTVGKREVSAGSVRLRKIVRTEHQEVPIELQHEEVVVERVPAGDPTAVPDSAFQEGEIEVPITREEPVVSKQARVTGQVRVEKSTDTESTSVGGDIRREEVDVDRELSDEGDGTSSY